MVHSGHSNDGDADIDECNDDCGVRLLSASSSSFANFACDGSSGGGGEDDEKSRLANLRRLYGSPLRFVIEP